MNPPRKTWPYGTQRKAIVKIANWRPEGIPSHVSSAQLLCDELGEMHVCVYDGAADITAKAGDTGVLTFTQGGPTGGYWKFTRNQ